MSLVSTGLALAWALAQGQKTALSRRKFSLLALPGVLMLLAFYSLAIHMHMDLGQWPQSIGTRGLSPALIGHAEVAYWFFGTILLVGLALPLLLVVHALVPKLRRHTIYSATFGVTTWICLALTFLAPSGFLYWWWD